MSATEPHLAHRRERTHERRARLLGVGMLGAFALILVIAFSGGIPFLGGGGKTTLKARFADGSNVRSGQPVRISGIDVGKVTEVDGEAGGRSALVTMEIDEDERELLRRDARATVWWRTLLGRNMYIGIEPGSSRAAMSGDTIPIDRTAHQFELDQLLSAFSPAARSGLQSSIGGLAESFSDRAPISQISRTLQPALSSTARGLPAVRGERPGDLGRAMRGTSAVARALVRDESGLGELIDSADVTLGVVAARKSALAATLQSAPRAFAVAQRQLARLEGTLDRLDPLVEDLRPSTSRLDPAVTKLTSALRTTDPLLRTADPLLRSLRRALTALKASTRQATPLVTEFNPVAERLKQETLPYLKAPESDTGKPLHQLVGPLASEIANTSAAYDGQGNMISFEGGFSGRALQGLLPCTVLVTNPGEKLTCNNLNALFAQLMGQQPPTLDPEDKP